MTLSPIYCSECGAQNVPGAKFCVTCGHVMHIPEADAPQSTINSPGTGLLPQDSLLNKRYRILKLAGTGGMGAVYKAEDAPYENRPVAIKEMRQSSLNPQELGVATEQFKVEAIMLAHLQHPSLPRIYDHFLEGNRWYLVMDFIDGETLDERLRRTPGRKLPPPEALNIGIQLCRVLDYLHKRQPPVVFRDLKPSNVMLTPEGHLYLIDFGIARIFKPGQAKDTKAYGSIGYSAPEQFDREQTTAQADIYSLGITLHEMLSGNIPSLTPFHLPRLSFPGQPALERLAALIAQMIEMDKNKRPASIEKVRQELESIRDALKQAVYIPSTMQPAAPSTQYTPQLSQEPGHMTPTEFVPPMPATVAVPSFTESAPQPVVAAPQLQRRPVVGRNVLAIGSSRVRGTIVGIVIYTLASLLLVVVFGLGATQAQTSSSPIFNNVFPGLSGGPPWTDLILSLLFFLPFYSGVRFGPWVGLIVAFIGTLPADFLVNPAPKWYWFVGSAALGFIPGLAFMRTRGVYKQTSSILLAVFFSLAGIVVWNLIRVVGIFLNFSIDFAAFLPALLATILVQLVALVPFVILLLIMNSVTKTRAR
jgi:serine/threonine protein kinase